MQGTESQCHHSASQTEHLLWILFGVFTETNWGEKVQQSARCSSGIMLMLSKAESGFLLTQMKVITRAGSRRRVSAYLWGALTCTLLVVDKKMPSFTPKCLWDSHHLDDFRYKASGALLLCLALGFACGRKQLLNACTLGIQHDCMDRAPKHRTELWRHPQFLQNTNAEVQQTDLQDLVQFGATKRTGRMLNSVISVISLRKEKHQKARPHEQDEEWGKYMGSTGTIPCLLLDIEDSWRKWQGKK